MNLAELKSLNPKKPGMWPWPVKIAAFVAMFVSVVVAGAFLLWEEQWSNLGTIKREEEQLKEAFLVKKRQAINLDLIKKQLDETQQSLGALLKQLPSKSEMDALLTDINQAGLGRGLQFELFKPGAEVFRKPGPEVPKSSPGASPAAPKPGTETAKSGTDDSFAEQPIVLKVTGSYDDIGKFASDIAMLPRIVTLNDVAIAPVAKGGLSMDAIAKTFRYLSEEEIAARSKASGKK